MTRSLSSLTFAAALLAVVSGCHCGGTQTDRVYAEVELVYPGPDGSDLTAAQDAVYDFGPVFMGQTVAGKVRVRNSGNALLTLKAADSAEDSAKVGFDAELAQSKIFNLKFEPGITVEPGAEVELPTLFRPPQNPDKTVESEDHQAKVTLHVEGTRDVDATASLVLKGRGVSGVCDVDRVLDFGAVQKGTTARRSIRLRNPSQIPATVTIGDPYSSTGDHLSFPLAEGMPRGQVTLPAQTEQDLTFNFTPTLVKPYVAFLKIRASEQCPEVVVSLEGQGVDQVLSWEPALVDCSFSPLNYEVTREVTFSNLGLDPVDVAQFAPSSPVFRAIPGASFDGTKLTVPGKSDVKLQVGCKPVALGMLQGKIGFTTSLTGQPSGELGIKVLGGGPDIDVKPSSIVNFGQVAYFAGANPPSYQTRRIVVANVGTRPSANDDSANLMLGRLNGLNQRVAPYAVITPDPPILPDGGIPPDEFTVQISALYDQQKGISAAAVGANFTDLTVKFVPQSLGTKKATLVIPSNDPDEPEVTLQISAEAITDPPCSYAISPTALNYGVVAPPSFKDLPFTITNVGGNDCHLSDLDFSADTNPTYSLPTGPVATKTLTPNQSMTVNVRSWPQVAPGTTPVSLVGQVHFFANSPSQPMGSVQLSTTLVTPCLTIAPDELDFGTVALNCNSASRTFNVYNTCSTPVTLNSITVPVPAGFPNGQGGCTQAGGCPEFIYNSASVQLPYAIPSGSTPISFTANYKPFDLGADVGAIAINALQNGQNVVYLVPLSGNGDANGENTDIFQQDGSPQADILLTIDNSCSMAPFQNSLATNFASFMAYATQNGVDYHMAVTTTDDGPGGEQGKMRVGTNDPDRILTPSSTNVSAQFAAKVNVGVSGSGTETGLAPSLEALTAPLIATTNAGFLRPDANLGVVVVTDAPDQSPGTAAYYIAALTNIKGSRRANAFSFSAVAGFNPNPPSNCAGLSNYSYDTGPDDGKYAAVVSGTKGVKEEICTQNWSQTLQRLGKTLFGYRTSFFLTAVPDFNNGHVLDVSIDGTPVPQTDGQGAIAWTYDSATNSVNFEPAYVPEPGQTLTLHYFVSCYP